MPQNRQLAAIMFTDIVGYTALMGNDEKKAFKILNQNRQLQKPIIEKYGGRWIKELGDGVMASFTTVSEAVYAAKEMQHQCMQSHEFSLRIGIHQGEIVFENDDIFGDAVNIASRIQSVAPVGGIAISQTVHDNIANKPDIKTIFIKSEKLKNVSEAVRIYEVVMDSKTTNDLAFEKSNNINVDEKKSIAVLPFVNMSNDPEQEYFCDGISEEIINALAQINNLRVISRTSAFSFKSKNLDVRQIGKSLDVTTLLEGSVRKAGNRVRITTQLINVNDGSQLWSHKYDHELEDIFSIQENIAENVATALKGVLSKQEKIAIQRPDTIIEAYEYFLKGRQLLHRLVLDESKIMFEKAIELDSEYAPAYAGLSDVYSWLYEWEGSKKSDLNEADKNSYKALSLAKNLSESHSSRGYVLSLAKKYEEAENEFKKAIELNSNSFDSYYQYGRSCFARGQIEKSAELFLKASEVRTEDFQSLFLLSQSLRILGKNASEWMLKGIERAKKQLKINPADRRALSLIPLSLIEIGERNEALKWMNKGLELYPSDSGVLINAVCFFAKLGDKEKALDLLEVAVSKGFGKKDWIEHDPDYNSLRDEPRFKNLLSNMK
jgi:adenylate cyclase